ncbi:hypothetical protein [Azospirillum soli]|uniref:hypothetical protein n=1 Tax=Azospirillum soli TaxID=1304799 RepID=UPI001AE5EE84|nr:hypothetical protein [Azospirillum soli]MBP2315488.1 hypothetical protein [Azospirillum soli]
MCLVCSLGLDRRAFRRGVAVGAGLVAASFLTGCVPAATGKISVSPGGGLGRGNAAVPADPNVMAQGRRRARTANGKPETIEIISPNVQATTGRRITHVVSHYTAGASL